MKFRNMPMLIGLLLAPSLLAAQQDSSPRMAASPPADPAVRIAEMKTRLALTPEQEAALKPILQAERDSLVALRSRYEGKTSRSDRRAMMGEARGIRDRANAQVKPLLTETQQEEWKRIQEENRARMREAMKQRRQQAS